MHPFLALSTASLISTAFQLIKILRKQIKKVSFPLGEDDRYTDECKDFFNLKSILDEDASTALTANKYMNLNYTDNNGVEAFN